MSKEVEYLVFEKFGNRYEFRYRTYSPLEKFRPLVLSGQYFVVEAHKLFVPPRIGGCFDN